MKDTAYVPPDTQLINTDTGADIDHKGVVITVTEVVYDREGAIAIGMMGDVEVTADNQLIVYDLEEGEIKP